MAQEEQSASEWSSPWRRGRLLPALAWVFRAIAVAFIGYGLFSLVMRAAGIGIWKYGWVWSDLSPICMGGWGLAMTFAWMARTRKRFIVLLCIAALFIAMGVAILIGAMTRLQYDRQAGLTGRSAMEHSIAQAGTILHRLGSHSIAKAISGLPVMR